MNGDFLPVIDALIAQMRTSSDLQRKRQLQRSAARKIIRATSILRGEHDPDWPETLEEHSKKLIARYPGQTEMMDYLLAAS
ncbi:hypothetical protein PGO00_21660 [Klebsiella aerogenes]|uniref:hypothetical protein n=1 Tax=Klebsiella aerogenes TaxID=548 RepID=UPI0036D008C9